MSLKKFLIMLLAVFTVLTATTISVFAAEGEGEFDNSLPTGQGFENEFNLMPGKHFSITSQDTTGRGTPELLEKLFDQNTACGGIWGGGDSWYGAKNDFLTITFFEPTELSSMHLYQSGNYTYSRIEFFDEDGNVIHAISDDSLVANANAYGDQGAQKVTAFEAASVSDMMIVKSIKITVSSLKWDDARTYKIAEICLFGIHEHKFNTLGEVLETNSCSKPGLVEKLCYCGEKTTELTEPHYDHRIIENEKVFFRNGFTETGYLVKKYCATCSNMDEIATPDEGSGIKTEIGPLFVSLGYSIREFAGEGDGAQNRYAIQFGIGVNYDNIEDFKKSANLDVDEFEFGIVAASKAACADGNPLTLSAGAVTTQGNVVCKNYTQDEVAGYDIYSYSISGFTDANTEFHLSAYVYDGGKIYYLGEETTENSVTVNVNQFAELFN